MSAFDFDAAIRWARFDPKSTLKRRPDDILPFLDDTTEAGNALLLDTCVYIDQLQGRTPHVIDTLVGIRRVNHSTVAIQELMHTIGVLDPAHQGTPTVIRQIGTIVRAMPSHRVLTPDADLLGKAAVLSGILCRLQGYMKDDRFKALQDAVLFLQALKLGFTVLTRNVRDFDCLMQMIPSTRVLFYRRKV